MSCNYGITIHFSNDMCGMTVSVFISGDKNW